MRWRRIGLDVWMVWVKRIVAVLVGVIHGFLNFFDINFDRLHFSKYTDQCVRINFPEDF